ncbi:type II secretion system protein M [bacterium]|nr:type II secretion system protein M [bacterium]
MNLAPRERNTVICGAVLLLMLLLYFGIIEPKQARLEELKDRIPLKEQQIVELKNNIQDYYRLKQLLDEQKQKIDKRGNEPFMQSYLESEAAALDMIIASMVPKNVDLDDTYREDQIELKLESITLDTVVKFLYRIENSPKMLTVKNVRLKRRYDDKTRIDATLTITTLIVK